MRARVSILSRGKVQVFTGDVLRRGLGTITINYITKDGGSKIKRFDEEKALSVLILEK